MLKVFNGSIFKNLGGGAASSTAPTSNVTGDLWYDSVNGQLKVWNGSAFILVGPASSIGAGTSGTVVDVVTDNVGTDHIVVKLFVEDDLIATISKDATFTPASALAGFPTISPGLQLSTTVSNAKFKGTSTDSELLDGIDSTAFLSAVSNDTTSGTLGVLNDNGLRVGVDSDFSVTVSGTDVLLSNTTQDGDINFRVNDGGTTVTVLNIDGATSSVRPGGNLTVNLGTTTLRFNTIYADVFDGRATTAAYADLAERFEADQPYPAGTVVELGGEAEITLANEPLSERVFGVISEKAAYLMNARAGSDETHPPVAMSGRVPVRVVGRVNKGDRLVSAGMGLAKAAASNEATAFNVIGRALESKATDGEGTIEAIVTVN